MRRFVSALVGTIVTAAGVSGSSQAAAPWRLAEHVVATDLRGAYDVVAADMNRDGRVDLIAVAGAMHLAAHEEAAVADPWDVPPGLAAPVSTPPRDEIPPQPRFA